MKKLILFIFGLLSGVAGYAQCNDSIILVETDTCSYVRMTTEKFTEFYVARTNLDAISRDLPKVKRTLDSLDKVNKEIIKNRDEQVAILNEVKTTVVQSYEDCSSELLKSELKNEDLRLENKKLKKQRYSSFLAGAGIGSVIIIIIILL